MKVKEAIKYEIKCRHCGSQLEFGLNDIQFFPNATEPQGILVCPVCGRDNQTHYGYFTKKDSFHLLDGVKVIYEEESENNL